MSFKRAMHEAMRPSTAFARDPRAADRSSKQTVQRFVAQHGSIRSAVDSGVATRQKMGRMGIHTGCQERHGPGT